MKTILIIGLGQFGTHIAKRMSDLRCEVMAVDIDEERVNAILPYVTNARIGDSTNEEFLRSLGVATYDICIVALGSLFQSSLETTSLLNSSSALRVERSVPLASRQLTENSKSSPIITVPISSELICGSPCLTIF